MTYTTSDLERARARRRLRVSGPALIVLVAIAVAGWLLPLPASFMWILWIVSPASVVAFLFLFDAWILGKPGGRLPADLRK